MSDFEFDAFTMRICLGSIHKSYSTMVPNNFHCTSGHKCNMKSPQFEQCMRTTIPGSRFCEIWFHSLWFWVKIRAPVRPHHIGAGLDFTCSSSLGLTRVDIWRDRRSCKILFSRVNFSENNANCTEILPENRVIVLVVVKICCLLSFNYIMLAHNTHRVTVWKKYCIDCVLIYPIT